MSILRRHKEDRLVITKAMQWWKVFWKLDSQNQMLTTIRLFPFCRLMSLPNNSKGKIVSFGRIQLPCKEKTASSIWALMNSLRILKSDQIVKGKISKQWSLPMSNYSQSSSLKYKIWCLTDLPTMLFRERFLLMGQVSSIPSKDQFRSHALNCSSINNNIWFTIRCIKWWGLMIIRETLFTIPTQHTALTILVEEQQAWTTTSSLFKIIYCNLYTKIWKICRTNQGLLAFSPQ